MEEIARILSASTHYEVLQIDRGAILVQQTTTAVTLVIRRRYKELAIKVHPDKNKAAAAEDAFKRLSEAYECLADENTRRAYHLELERKTQRPPRPPPPARPPPPHYPKKTKTKTKKRPPPPPPPPSSGSSPSPPVRRWRTPEEVWDQFQREEEEIARREFHAKGFDRDYEQQAPPPSSRKMDQTKEQQDQRDKTLTDEGLETRANEWSSWKRARTGTVGDTPQRMSPTSATTAPLAQSSAMPPSTGGHYCLLCRRKFPSVVALTRHEQKSELHRQNLARISRFSQTDEDDNETSTSEPS